MCDLCFAYRESVQNSHDQRLIETMKEWKIHLDIAEYTRITCNDSVTSGKSILRSNTSNRLPLGVVSFDFVKQVYVPMLSDQTMNEWFAQKKRFDVNVLGIVNQGVSPIGEQHNYIYGECTKNGASQVVSMIHYF